MSGEESDIWKRRKKEREEKKARGFRRTIANCGLASLWGIAIVYSWFLFTHQGLAEIFLGPEQVPNEWATFSFLMIQLLLLLSMVVTGIYLVYRTRSRNIRN